MGMFLTGSLVFAVLLVVIIAGTYNRLVALRQNVRESWSIPWRRALRAVRCVHRTIFAASTAVYP